MIWRGFLDCEASDDNPDGVILQCYMTELSDALWLRQIWPFVYDDDDDFVIETAAL